MESTTFYPSSLGLRNSPFRLHFVSKFSIPSVRDFLCYFLPCYFRSEYVACDVPRSLYLLDMEEDVYQRYGSLTFFSRDPVTNMAAVERTQRPNGHVCYA